MTAKSRVSAVDTALADNYFKKAQEYRDSMNQALADRRPNARNSTFDGYSKYGQVRTTIDGQFLPRKQCKPSAPTRLSF